MVDGPLIVTAVGTDHHVYDRLIDWIDEYATSREGKARFIVQHGYSRTPRAENIDARDILGFDEFQELLRTTDVLVAGGPITLLEALEYGIRPISVPRELSRKEHVDNNQVDFSRVFAAEGKIELPKDKEEMFAMLDEALEQPGRYRFDPSEEDAAPGIGRIAEVVDALVWGLPVPGA
jgi:UDP-N-acetylglucosamine transferase subunit ALG13